MLKLNAIAAAALITALSALPQAIAERARPLDTELGEIAALLPGRYLGERVGAGGTALFHKIVPITAPQFGARVFYHQISRDGFDSAKPLQQKIYVLDESRSRRINSMRAWVFRPGQGFANLEQDSKALAALTPAMLMSFPKGCEIRWARGAGAREFSATVRRGDRVVVKTVEGEVLAKQLRRQTARTIELASLNPEHPDRVLNLDDIAFMARVIWASQ